MQDKSKEEEEEEEEDGDGVNNVLKKRWLVATSTRESSDGRCI